MNPSRLRRTQNDDDDDDDTSFPTPPNSRLPQTTYGQKFPPHPSVRVPPNVKMASKQRQGVGVASPPPPISPSPRQGQILSPNRPRNGSPLESNLRAPNSGKLVQGFKFPQAPPPIPRNVQSKRSREPIQSPSQRFNMYESYVSSIADDSTTNATTPNNKNPRFPSARVASSLYPDSEILKNEEYDGESAFGDSKPSSPSSPPTIVRQASMGKRGKPALTTIKNADNDPKHRSQGEPNTAVSSTSDKTTINALSAAVARGMSPQPQGVLKDGSHSRTGTPVRMPFESSGTSSRRDSDEDLQPPQLRSEYPSNKSNLRLPSPTHSEKSGNPLLGLGIDEGSLNNKTGAKKRPPMLDMDAIREAENRGSTTSLVELIRRATKLAANLDRGKTASKLGMLDMFGSSDKLGKTKRDSDMSDMISAFPAPANGGTPRRDAQWPLGEKGLPYDEREGKSGKKKRRSNRRICGMSVMVFVLVVVTIILIAAAAVLIPIFLVLEPRSKANSPTVADCSRRSPCGNGGTSVVNKNTCGCVCSNGFVGDQCQTTGGSPPECATMTMNDGVNHYENATMGSSILPLFSQSKSTFNVPLNTSTILSIFASSNLTCTSENALVDFNSSVKSRKSRFMAKRFIMLPEFGSLSLDTEDKFTIPHPAEQLDTNRRGRFQIRQDTSAVGTSYGIVFQATSATQNVATATNKPTSGSSTAPTAASTVTSMAPSNTLPSSAASPSSTSSPSSDIPENHITFAKIVVMYVLQASDAISVAVNAQQRIEGYFESASANDANTQIVNVGYQSLKITADFGLLQIKDGQGNIVGGIRH